MLGLSFICLGILKGKDYILLLSILVQKVCVLGKHPKRLGQKLQLIFVENNVGYISELAYFLASIFKVQKQQIKKYTYTELIAILNIYNSHDMKTTQNLVMDRQKLLHMCKQI